MSCRAFEKVALDAHGFEATWRSMLPPGVSFSAGFEPHSLVLSARERCGVVAGGPQRLREFATGRWHARRALTALGLGAAELPRRDDGAPAWPPGIVGSISHTALADRLFAVAAVAEADAFPGLGVDVEAPGQIEPRLWPGLFLPAELDALLLLPVPQRSLEASMLWSAKEAAVKAGVNRAGLGRMAISHDPEAADFTATSVCGAVHCVGTVVSTGGWIFAAAFLHPTPFEPSSPSVAASEPASTASCITPVGAMPTPDGVMSQSGRLRSIY